MSSTGTSTTRRNISPSRSSTLSPDRWMSSITTSSGCSAAFASTRRRNAHACSFWKAAGSIPRNDGCSSPAIDRTRDVDLGVAHGPELADDLGRHAQAAQPAVRGVDGTDDHRRVGHLLGQLVDEPGGADACLAAQEDDRRPARCERCCATARAGTPARRRVRSAVDDRDGPRSPDTRTDVASRTSTGSRLPFSTTGCRSRYTTRSPVSSAVSRPTSTSPGAAAFSRRAATLTVSPITVMSPSRPTDVTITGPLFTPMDKARSPPSWRMLNAAVTARSASSSCAWGTPKTAMSESPVYLSTIPPCSSTSSAMRRKAASTRARHRLGSLRSANDVNPTTSANSTVASLRSSAAGRAGSVATGAPAGQRRATLPAEPVLGRVGGAARRAGDRQQRDAARAAEARRLEVLGSARGARRHAPILSHAVALGPRDLGHPGTPLLLSPGWLTRTRGWARRRSVKGSGVRACCLCCGCCSSCPPSCSPAPPPRRWPARSTRRRPAPSWRPPTRAAARLLVHRGRGGGRHRGRRRRARSPGRSSAATPGQRAESPRTPIRSPRAPEDNS